MLGMSVSDHREPLLRACPRESSSCSPRCCWSVVLSADELPRLHALLAYPKLSSPGVWHSTGTLQGTIEFDGHKPTRAFLQQCTGADCLLRTDGPCVEACFALSTRNHL